MQHLPSRLWKCSIISFKRYHYTCIHTFLWNPLHCAVQERKKKGGKIAAAFWKSLQQQLVCARIRVDTAPTPVMKCLECLIVWQTHWYHKIYGVTFEFLNSLTIFFLKNIDCALTEISKKQKWDFINHSTPLCAMMATQIPASILIHWCIYSVGVFAEGITLFGHTHFCH